MLDGSGNGTTLDDQNLDKAETEGANELLTKETSLLTDKYEVVADGTALRADIAANNPKIRLDWNIDIGNT